MKVRNEIPEARWSKGSNIIETFAVELEEFTQTGTVPAHAGQDIGWSLAQQKRRLDALDLDLDYEFIPRGHFGRHQGATKEWSDGHYISRMGYRSCRFCRTISRNGRKLMKQERNVLLYQTITDVHMENLYLWGNSIRKKDDVFRLQLKRDVSKPVDLHFSVHHLRCKNCAASFDALRHKNCPSCGSVYGTEDLEWIITDLRKK